MGLQVEAVPAGRPMFPANVTFWPPTYRPGETLSLARFRAVVRSDDWLVDCCPVDCCPVDCRPVDCRPVDCCVVERCLVGCPDAEPAGDNVARRSPTRARNRALRTRTTGFISVTPEGWRWSSIR